MKPVGSTHGLSPATRHTSKYNITDMNRNNSQDLNTGSTSVIDSQHHYNAFNNQMVVTGQNHYGVGNQNVIKKINITFNQNYEGAGVRESSLVT